MEIISFDHGIDDSRQVYIGRLISLAEKEIKDLNPTLEEFRALVEGDVTLRTLSSQMFEEVPMKPPYNKYPKSYKSQVRGFNHLLQIINYILTHAPKWDANAFKVEWAAVPICALTEGPKATESGEEFFLRHDVNQQWAKILNAWAKYLASEDSATVLNDSQGGWFGEDAMDALVNSGNIGKSHYTFDQLYVCDSAAPHRGFASWDDFFIRRFKPGVRPVSAPEGGPPDPNVPDPTAVIIAACEAVPVCVAKNVQARAGFWLKGQPYSILDMMANDELASDFAGGTVYQAYLSAVSYHRWHSPISGTVAKTCLVPGTYFSSTIYFQGIVNPDSVPPNHFQPYITEVATRGLVFIQADKPDIGLMCIVFVGMGEVSTCDIAVKPGQHVTKGDEIGTFHFGGSTYCMVFRKVVDLLFEQFEKFAKYNKPVLSRVAVVQCHTKGT
ncbi:hypothetical protein MMC22_009202 [Lobaria immixta]|nr:hypothetical protein [Lobaria immixta]